MSKRIKMILMVSLALNIALMGVIGGHLLKGKPPHGQWQARMVDKMVSALPQEKQADARAQYQAALGNEEVNREAMKQAQKAIEAVLVATEFDANAYKEAVSQMGVQRQEKMQRMVDVTANIAKDLSLEERQKLAEALARRKH